MSIVELQDFQLRIADRLLCSNLNLQVSTHQCWGLLGRNGAGKTTLLHSLIGIHLPTSGRVLIGGEPLASLPRREVARLAGILFQDRGDSMPATVMETVMLGRYPHSQSLLRDDEEDIERAREALRSVDLSTLEQRQVSTLSGGERQRLALAVLLAQAPALYLLDEPSNHLDVSFQIRLLSLLQSRIESQPCGLIIATHDINLAARFCDHLVLMMHDGTCVQGSTTEVLTEANLSAAYGCQIRSMREGELTLYYPA